MLKLHYVSFWTDTAADAERVTWLRELYRGVYERDTAGVAAVLESGQRVSGSAVVGADGLRSHIRRQLVGDGAPRVSGHTIYRSVIPIEEMDEELRGNTATLWAGPGYHMVHYPIADRKSFNMAATIDNGARTVVIGAPVTHDEVRETFADAHAEIRTMLDRGRDWHSWVLCDHDPVATWTDGPVVLIGDAAHPMLQYAAQGAAMALEDAVCLDAVLREKQDFARAFTRLETLRAQRTAQVQLTSRRMGKEIYHPAGREALARNEILSRLSQQDLFDKVDWLYAHEAVPVT